MFRRRPAKPQRKAHPDPGIENELQRLLYLRLLAAAKLELLSTYRREIEKTSDQIRSHTSNLNHASPAFTTPHEKAIAVGRARVADLQAEIRRNEKEADEVWDKIVALQSTLRPEDLAYMETP